MSMEGGYGTGGHTAIPLVSQLATPTPIPRLEIASQGSSVYLLPRLCAVPSRCEEVQPGVMGSKPLSGLGLMSIISQMFAEKGTGKWS